MSIIQGGRWEGFMRRMFSLKGEQEPQSTSPELIGTVSVIPPRLEDGLLRGDKLYHQNQTSTSAAANRGFVGLYNQSKNQLVIIDMIRCWSGAASDFQLRMGNVAFGTGPITITGRDTRQGIVMLGARQAGAMYYGHVPGVSGNLVQRFETGAGNVLHEFFPDIVLGPGGAAYCWNNTVNQTHAVDFAWREREAEPGELNW